MSNKKIFLIILFYCFIHLTNSRFFQCPETSSPPQALDDSTPSIPEVIFDIDPLTPVILSGQILINNHNSYVESKNNYLTDSFYCPSGYVIIKKEELDIIIKDLGENAYSTFTDTNGLDMSEGIYYNTNTKGKGKNNKIFMILKNGSITFEDFDPLSYVSGTLSGKFHTICKLSIPDASIIFPDDKRDFDYGYELELNINGITHFTDFIWKINDQIIKEEIAKINLTESGVNNVEFWGKYISGTEKYLCEIFYVGKEKVANDQKFSKGKIKKIKTDFKLNYNPSLHFTTSNCPVAPRDDGGYYIAVPDVDKYLHILSFDKNDNLIKDFNTEENARPHDITTTYLGFAVYCVDANNRDHSYITLYNKDFEMIKRVIVMNNVNTKENQLIDSTPDKQLIRYNNKGKAQYGIRFIYQADNAKLVYSRGRIFLIFAHYNIFDDDYKGHNADTVATFNDNLEDTDFGIIFGASHSLIQSVTFDNNYFWTATLSDAYPQGIRVQYISKREFQNNYDAVFKKNNIRVSGSNSDLAGYIKGYFIGWADGKLGGILYFENFELYCLVYAKTPDYTEGNKNGKAVIYITTWKFTDKKIVDITTKEIKVFETGNIMQVRAGKYGNDKIIITYLGTNRAGHNYYGNIPAGSVPNIFVVELPDLTLAVDDEKMDDLLMNTNEDLRTFENGVLIWATSDANNYLVINKIDAFDKVPSIIWKDIYKLKMNGVKTINDTEIHGPTINLRGISNSGIVNKHTFNIYLIFQKINNALRNLEEDEENEIKLPAICELGESNEETSEEFKLVDYECIGEQSSEHLTNYKLVNIEEGNNQDSLKESNLNELVSEIKDNKGELQNLESVEESGYTQEKLNKIVIFKTERKITRINADDYKFNFKINGNLNKEITSGESTINQELELNEIDKKANCKFTKGNNKLATIGCELNVENYKNIKEFSFKTSWINTPNNEIYLSNFNDIILTNSKEKEDDDDNSWVIAVSVICAIVAAFGIGFGIYFILKKRKLQTNNIGSEVDVKSSEKINEVDDVGKSSNRVITYKNK